VPSLSSCLPARICLFLICACVADSAIAAPRKNAAVHAAPPSADEQAFAAEVAKDGGPSQQSVLATLSGVRVQQSILDAIARPAEATKPWKDYRPIFVTDKRTDDGIAFYRANRALLDRVSAEYGVPAEIVVAIIGVETSYGRIAGKYRVIDALSTLAFDVPARGDFFRGELEEFLLLCREQNWDPLTVKGSFAGAMGLAQFMPGSYRRHAMDYDGDGHIDLWNNSTDVIGSVASYLHFFGWKDGQPIVAPARVEAVDPRALLDVGLKPSLTLEQWRARGARPLTPMPDVLNASMFSLDLIGGAEYWFGFDNFYALLQYNRSRNYVMAIYELSIEITRERERVAAGITTLDEVK